MILQMRSSQGLVHFVWKIHFYPFLLSDSNWFDSINSTGLPNMTSMACRGSPDLACDWRPLWACSLANIINMWLCLDFGHSIFAPPKSIKLQCFSSFCTFSMADQFVHHGSSPEVIAGGVVVLVRQLVKAAPSEALHFWDGSRMRSPIFDIFDAVLRCHSALQGRGKAQPFLSFAAGLLLGQSHFSPANSHISPESAERLCLPTNLSVHQLASNSSTWGWAICWECWEEPAVWLLTFAFACLCHVQHADDFMSGSLRLSWIAVASDGYDGYHTVPHTYHITL